MTTKTLPVDLAASISVWANENNLTPGEAAAAVRTALKPLGEVWMVTERDLQMISTTYRHGLTTIRTAMIISRSEITPLEWKSAFHPSGTIHNDDCNCTDYEDRRISVGQTIQIGDWTWSGLDTGLNGFHITTGEA